MKFIAVDYSSAKNIVAKRSLQSTEYAEGDLLSSVLESNSDSKIFIDGIHIVQCKNGVAIIGNTPESDNFIVIDLEQFSGFLENSSSDKLSIFQKICRLSLKYWENIPFSSREFSISNSDFIVLIPKKDSISDGARVVIDIKPDWNRQEKRESRHLLAFYYGTNKTDTKPSTTNFRKAIEESKKAKAKNTQKRNVEAPLHVEKLETEFKPIDSNTSFDTWKNLLTDTQSKFVFRENHGPERIEGAAGTGKTLSLSLRCCNVLNSAYSNNTPLKAAFLTHSQASKEYIENIIFPKLHWYDKNSLEHKVELEVVTLQEWCIRSLGNKIEETELLDKDAQNAKNYQQMLISDVITHFKESTLTSHEKFISESLFDFFSSKSTDIQVQALQFEIAEIIKGRSAQDLSKYKKTGSLGHAVPLKNENDFECLYSIYSKYQKKLETSGYFDSDDVILSALGQLDSPIWRRRKNSEGFDILFVDETHLFNLNELSIIHHLLKEDNVSNIIYSVDRTQSLGSISLENSDLDGVFGNNNSSNVSLQTIFRSSPDIIRLAFSVLSSGSTIFTNMENPLDRVEDSFTLEEEKRSQKPYLIGFDTDDLVIENVFKAVDKLAVQTISKRSKIIVVASTDSILSKLERFARHENKPAEFIKKRGDKRAQEQAEKGNKYLFSGIDYVGGLEFDAVVIVGADRGHLPATEENNIDAKHFLNHASYNRMYVAITRAKFGVSILYCKTRGISKILQFSVNEKTIDESSL
ncbi:UvrD-helicase domain-containing protein [Aliikangiella sp. IMCC44359]|uniref:UvrD-helicase domain-containing protein n=1 Tax=Aliikangiella sp. IMCC44359 TaxID=3459125 RepID=UPI00403AFBF4